MALQSEQRQSSGFGKRGVVAPPQPQRQAFEQDKPNGGSDAAKWIGGGVAAVAVLALVGTGGGSGGGLLGGLIGGLLGQKLAQGTGRTPVAAPAVAPATTTVQRGGFGTTGSSAGFSSGS